MGKKRYFGELEAQILNHFKKDKSFSLKEIHARFDEMAYTTIQTVLNRLVKKGILKRTKKEGIFVYFLGNTNTNVSKHFVSKFKGFFSHQMIGEFVAHLVEDENLTQEDLKEIKHIIEKKIKE